MGGNPAMGGPKQCLYTTSIPFACTDFVVSEAYDGDWGGGHDQPPRA